MIILDTHVWLWWMNESSKLSVNALEAINTADVIGIPAISCWEIAMLVEKSRIGLSMDVQIWLDLALQYQNVQLLPLTPEIAVRSTRLPKGFHGDPSDRLIVASSLVHKASLVSKNETIRQYSYLQVIW
jgi:PIN domain nuclease of toxin-antitoxin system